MPIPRPAGAPLPGPSGIYHPERQSRISTLPPQANTPGYTHRVLLVLVRHRRGTLHTQTDDRLATQNNQAQRPLHLLHRPCLRLAGLLLWPYAAELFAFREDEVHVAVEGEHLADERAAVVDRNFEPPVYEAQHLAALGLRWRLQELI